MKVDTYAKGLFFTTVNILTINGDDSGSGTGFLYNAAGENQSAQLPVLVTNKHVIKGARKGLIRFIGRENGEPKLGQRRDCIFEDFENRWVAHPDPSVDVAVMPLAPVLHELKSAGLPPYYQQISSSLCPTEKVLKELDAIHEITFVGYPRGLFDEKNLTPIVRRGITATPIHLEWNGDPCFLVDASVFPGSSGSPVFILEQGSVRRGNLMDLTGIRVVFLGIIASVHVLPSIAPIIATQYPSAKFDQMIDLGVVFNWRAIEQTVDELCRVHGIDRKTTS